MTVETQTIPSRSDSKLRKFVSLCSKHPLLLITALAALLHFTYLSRPPLLIDECFTFWRTCGSYHDLVETLRDDGFVPLHYEFLWWIHQGFPLTSNFRLVPGGLYLTPNVMRFVPAICGTLMVPTIFFVARQLLSRRASLLAALFVACSAYGQFFSRDSKMYMPAWFLGTLGVGCLLWWLRTGKSTAWLAWIAAGSAAAGVHIVTALLLALAPIFLLTQSKAHWRQTLLLLLGIILIASGPAGYYGVFNQWSQKSGGLVPGVATEPAPDANWSASGLGWLGDPSSGAQSAFQSLSTYLTAYEWNGSTEPRFFQVTPDWMRRSVIAIVSLMLFFLVIGMLPWPEKLRGSAPATDPPTEAWWRATLWLTAWIAIPAYAFFYCRSFDEPASPLDWLSSIGRWWGSACLWLVPVTIVAAFAAARWRRFAMALICLTTLAACIILVYLMRGQFDPVSSALALNPIRWTLLIIVPAAVWAFLGDTFSQRCAKLAQFSLIAGLLLLLCLAAHAAWEHVHARALAKNPDLQWHTIWHTRYLGIVWPAVWIVAAALIVRLPTKPARLVAIIFIVMVNLTNGIARSVVQTQVPYDRVFAEIWQSQPGAPTRTYFDLNTGMGGFFSSGAVADGNYWTPIASYDAALAGQIQTTPADFRSGKTWPFHYGPMMDRFEKSVVYRPYVAASDIAADVSQSPELKRIIIWQRASDESPETDRVRASLGPKWHLVHEDVIRAWWYWTWDPRMLFRRREFVRSGA